MGGLASLSGEDLSHSWSFFVTHFASVAGTLRFDRALDLAAGIGRVTDGFLRHFFNHIDLVETGAVLEEDVG